MLTQKNYFGNTPTTFVRATLHPQWYVNLSTGEYSENGQAIRGFCGKRRKDGRLYTSDGIPLDELVFTTALKRELSDQALLRHIDGDRTNNALSNLRMEKRPTFAQIRSRSVTSLFQPVEVKSDRGDQWCFLSKHACARFLGMSVGTVFKFVTGQRAIPTCNSEFGQLTFRAIKESEINDTTTFLAYENSRVPVRYRHLVKRIGKTLREMRETESAQESDDGTDGTDSDSD